MFTFSFGTALAAEKTEAEKIAEAVTAAQKVVDDAVAEALVELVFDSKGYLYDAASWATGADMLTEAVVKAAVAAEKDAQYAEIAKVEREQSVADTFDQTGFDAITTGYDEADVMDNAFAKAATWNAQLELDKVAALAAIKTINPADFNAFDYDPADGDQSDKAKVAEELAYITKMINDMKDIEVLADIKDAIDDCQGLVEAVKTGSLPLPTMAEYEKNLADAKTTAKDAINTAADALVTSLTSTYEAAVAAATTPSQKADAQAKLAAVKPNVKKVVDKYAALIDAVAITKDVNPTAAVASILGSGELKDTAVAKFANEGALNAELAVIGNVEALIDYAKTYADGMKKELASDGLAKYNAATVDAKLAEVTAKIQNDELTTLGAVKTAMDGATLAADEASAFASAVTAAQGAITAYASLTDYEDAQQKEIKALCDAAVEATKAAADQAGLDAIVKDYKVAVDKLAKKSEVTAVKAAAEASYATNLAAKITAYYDYMETVNATKYTAANQTAAEKAAKDAVVEAVLAAIDAAGYTGTADQVKAIDDVVKASEATAKAAVDAIKTADEIKAEADKVVALIDAIPSTVTLADEATVQAAADALAAYEKLIGATPISATKTVIITKAQATLQKLADAEVKALTDALDKKLADSALTAADEAAYTAAEEAIKAHDAKYAPYTWAKKADVKAAIDAAKYADAAKALAAIPAEINADNIDAAKAAVEAARAAFDSLEKAQQATIAESLKKALTEAEAKVAALDAEAKAEEDKEAVAKKAANDAYVQGVCENVTLKFNGKKLSSGKTAFYFGEKGAAKLQKFEDMGYVLEFKYYKAESKTKPTAPKCNTYMSTSKGKKTAENGYQMVPTKGTKGMFYAYAAEINVYDAEDNLVATIAKDQVNFGWAKWTGKTIK